MEIKIVQGVMTIKTPLSEGHLSGSGKSLIIATTNGFVPVDGHPDIKVSLNVIKKR